MSTSTSPASVVGNRGTTRRSIALVAFGIAYYLLAIYAVRLPLEPRLALLIWPAHGIALGTLLVAAPRRWPAYLGLAAVATIAAGLDSGAGAMRVAWMTAVAVAYPLVVAAGLLKLAGPRVQVDSIRGVASFFVGMSPLVAGVAFADVLAEGGSPMGERWSMAFVSTMLAMLLTAPVVLAWSRPGAEQAMVIVRARFAELIVLYAGLMVATNYVFGMGAPAAALLPPLIYLTAPFLVWAALRFGLRATTLAIAIFGLICYWHTAHGVGPFALDPVTGARSLLHLQGYLATLAVTAIFAAALVVERHDAGRETEEWRNRHEAVIRASGNLLYELDPRTGTLVWDGDTRAVLGVDRANIGGLHEWMERVHPEDRLRLKGLRHRLLRGDIASVAIEYRFRRDDGAYATLGVNAYRIGDAAQPGARRIIGFVQDISEKIRAEEERKRLEAQLKQAEKMQAVGHLAGGIAHDFNNILGAILGYGELAQRKAQSDGDMRRYLDTIMSAGNRAKALVTQILSYSRAEGAAKVPVIVGPIAQEVCDLIGGSSPLAVDLRFTEESGDSAVLGDPTRIHQLIMNLCTNALHAMGQGGVLGISVGVEVVEIPRKVRSGEIPAGDYVRLSVSDTGHGIAPEVIDRIFEPFFTTKPAGRGTGLGLALVHSVVMEHHGFIDVASELGRGTTFTVWLPRVEAQEGAVEAPEVLPQGEGQVVMAVDDEADVLRALEEMLAQLGYEPVGFSDSREALAAARADPKRFDAMVTDEVMPEMVGTQLVLEVRALNPAIPVVIASGYGGAGFEARALSAGVNRVLRKPYRMAEIAEALAGFFPKAD